MGWHGCWEKRTQRSRLIDEVNKIEDEFMMFLDLSVPDAGNRR